MRPSSYVKCFLYKDLIAKLLFSQFGLVWKAEVNSFIPQHLLRIHFVFRAVMQAGRLERVSMVLKVVNVSGGTLAD